MSTSPSRRLLAGLASATLLLGGLVLAESATAAGPCPTYTDPAGDAFIANTTTGESPTDNDPDLDILAVSHSVDSDVFTSVIKLTGLSDAGPAISFYDRFTSLFTVAKKPTSIRVDRDFSGGSKPVITPGLVVDGVLTTAKVTAAFDFKASTVTLGVAVADLEKAVGTSLAGLPFSAMSSTAREPFMPAVVLPVTVPVLNANSVQLNQTPDTATAPATASYVFGGSCSGGGTPVPTPTETPAPNPAPEAPSLFAFPRAGCQLYKDPVDDAEPGKSPVTLPLSDTDLDFTAVSVKSAPDALVVYAKINALSSPDTPIYTGHKFTSSFTVNGKTITAVATGPGAATTTPATAKATAVFDKVKSYVIFTFPAADLATAAGAPLPAGTAVTNLTWKSNGTNQLGDFDGDTAAGTTPAEKSYAVGDNTCFQPPAGILTLDTTGRGVYTDASVVDVALTDVDENAVSGASVKLELTGMPATTLLTDDDGIAEFTFPITVPAGAKTLTATFLGTSDVGATGAGAPFTVAPETSVLKAVAGKGSVTATLTDNDKTAIAGQLVAFKVGSKVTKVKTNAKGVAVLSRLTKGSTVAVSFAAVTGKYTAAKPVSVKVL